MTNTFIVSVPDCIASESSGLLIEGCPEVCIARTEDNNQECKNKQTKTNKQTKKYSVKIDYLTVYSYSTLGSSL